MDLKALEAKSFRGKGRTQFLAQIEFIKSAVEAGYPKSLIWRELKEKNLFDAKSDQFLDYIEKYVSQRKRQRNPLELKTSIDQAVHTTRLENNHPGSLASDERLKSSEAYVPKPFKWNPQPLTDEEIKTGIVTSR